MGKSNYFCTGFEVSNIKDDMRINEIIERGIMRSYFKQIQLSTLALFLFTPVLLYAHPDFGNAAGFWHGFAHPFSGLDHILAMVAVGIWAVQVGGKATWLIPLSFVCMMVIGGFLGISGVNVPFVEKGIIMSVLILGILIAASVRLPVIFGMIIVGLFALCHGHAHGTEIPNAISGITYSIGFALSIVILHMGGIGVGLYSGKISKLRLVRYAGAAIAFAGVTMLVI
jgi:urease accessory protein